MIPSLAAKSQTLHEREEQLQRIITKATMTTSPVKTAGTPSQPLRLIARLSPEVTARTFVGMVNHVKSAIGLHALAIGPVDIFITRVDMAHLGK